MTFLVLLLALALEKFSGWRRRIQRDGAWLAWLGLVEDLPSVSRRSWLGLLLAVVLPLLPLALLLTLLQPLAYGWLSLPLHLLVVVYSLGRGDVMADLGPFRDAWRRGEYIPRDRYDRYDDWRDEGWREPYGDERYVVVDGRYYLINAATGLILQALTR